jgi:hypothetical protein
MKTFRVLHLLSIMALFVTSTLWGGRHYRFSVTVNDSVYQIETEFNRDNNFQIEIPTNLPLGTYIWRLHVYSPDLTNEIYETKLGSRSVYIQIRYREPFFSVIDFETLQFQELLLLMGNEETEVKQAIVSSLAMKLRIDAFKKMLSDLTAEEWGGIQESYLVGLQLMYDAYSTPDLLSFIIAVHSSEKFPESHTSIMLMGLGLSGVESLGKAIKTVREDNELKEFVIQLALASPRNRVYQYLLDESLNTNQKSYLYFLP